MTPSRILQKIVVGSSHVTAASAAGSFRVVEPVFVVWLGGATEGVYVPGRPQEVPALNSLIPHQGRGCQTTGLQSKAPTNKNKNMFYDIERSVNHENGLLHSIGYWYCLLPPVIPLWKQ